MSGAGISLSLGLGGGKTSTATAGSGSGGGGGGGASFNVGTLDTAADIITDYTGEDVGFIAYATDTDQIYIKSSTAINEWRSWANDGSV